MIKPIQIVLFISIISLAGCSSHRRLTDDAYLNGFDDKQPFTVIEAVEQLDASQMRIYLIRHAKPDVKKFGICTASMAQAYVTAYNKAPIIPFDTSLVNVRLQKRRVIHCSTLRRAHETAHAIFGDQHEVVPDDIYREFETRIVGAGNVYKLPLVIWQSVSRIGWVMGLNTKDIESYGNAIDRAHKAATQLENLAQQEQLTILVAHGMLNRSIAKELKRRGWQLKQKQGHINIGATILEKER